jgi:hypothetical protein
VPSNESHGPRHRKRVYGFFARARAAAREGRVALKSVTRALPSHRGERGSLRARTRFHIVQPAQGFQRDETGLRHDDRQSPPWLRGAKGFQNDAPSAERRDRGWQTVD